MPSAQCTSNSDTFKQNSRSSDDVKAKKTISRRAATHQPTRSKLAGSITADQLANELASKLTLADGKGKQKAVEPSHDTKSSSMRSVNSVSQTLTAIVQSGWKKSTSDSSTRATLTSANSAASSAAKHLAVLRRLCPNDIDVERAAVSVLGKLVSLEMYDLAATFLSEIHPRLCSLLNTSGTVTSVLEIPQPTPPPTDTTLLTLISTYLIYALTIKTQSHSITSKVAEELVSTISPPNRPSLLVWLPAFAPLPSTHLDSLLTRAYTCINKLCSYYSAPPSPSAIGSRSKPTPTPFFPEALFTLRMYAMRCLVHTTPGVIEANTFWDQTRRFTVPFVKSAQGSSEEQATRMILTSYTELVQLAEQRPDQEVYMAINSGAKGFVAFCEYWSAFAKRAGDIIVLQKINSFIQPPVLSSSQSSATTSITHQAETHHQAVIQEGTRLNNALGQLSILLENASSSDNGDALRTSIQYAAVLLKISPTISALLQPSQRISERKSREEEEVSRICGRVDRAFEKVRRMSLKMLEAAPPAPSIQAVEADLRDFLLQCVSSLEQYPSLSTCNAAATRDVLTRCLDTLFVLSRTQVNPTNPTTFVPAFDLLSRALTILKSVPTDKFPLTPAENAVDIANYTRCVSGAFYNIAGVLYQAMRFGNAVPFLVEACSLGAKALRLPRSDLQASNETREKEWKQLEEQLFRRWELLGVCYSKNGDRKNAYNAFKESIHAFPFSSSGLIAQSNSLPPDILFGPDASPIVKQLSGLIERLSYLGACDLLLPPNEVSLASTVGPTSTSTSAATTLDASVIGVLLERQLDTLEPSRWKGGIRNAFVKLFRDALAAYADMPVRRARVLVRCMAFLYREQVEDTCQNLGFTDMEEMVQQVESLADMQSLGRDADLAHFIPQYRIAVNLWSALHSHRRADPKQSSIMTQRTEVACALMKEILVHVSETKSKASARKSLVVRKVSSPKVAKVAKALSPRATRTTRLRAVPAAPKKAAPAKTRSKAVVDPVTPKPRSRAVIEPTTLHPVQTTPRRSTDGTQVTKSALLFDNFDKFLSLLQLAACVLGMLSLILPKAHLLEMTRKLAQRQIGTTSEAFVIASLDLAHEYATLGRLKRATSIFTQALEIVRSRQTSEEIGVRFLLRFAESLALLEDVPKSSKVYLEALELSGQVNLEQKAASTQQRIHARATVLEMAATAANVFGLVQYTKGDVSTSLEGFLQSLRLWNRAVDTLARLNPLSRSSASSPSDSDPFSMTSMKDALPSTGSASSPQDEKKNPERRPPMDGLEWRISEGLLSTMLSLAQTYYLRGSAREAEYFARQATDLAEQLNAPALQGRALAKQGEIQLYMGHTEEAQDNLTKAAELLSSQQSIDTAEIRRLVVELNAKMTEAEDEAENLDNALEETISVLEALDMAFRQFDNLAFGPRRSLLESPAGKDHLEVLAPDVWCSVLRQRLWSLRDDPGDVFNAMLQKLVSLSYSSNNKAQENALMAKLTLHGVYDRFRTDMFLSSLTESTIAVPLGMGSKEDIRTILSSIEVMDALASAEKLLWAHLTLNGSKGNVIKVRDAAISLVLVSAFRTSLGDRRVDLPSTMVSLLDMSASLTLRRDMLEAIQHKVPPDQAPDDLQWPSLSEEGDHLPNPTPVNSKSRRFALSQSDSEDEDNATIKPASLKSYWDSVKMRYRSHTLSPSTLSSRDTLGFPATWTIINISVTSDKSTLFISRQQGGPDPVDPLIFCIPLKGRRESGDDDETQLTFDGAIQELHDIVRCSDECTKSAINIKADDEEARSSWWKQRGQLDLRMRDLLENIEYCWLGAFKTILSPSPTISVEAISELRGQFEKVFHRALHVKDKKPKPRATGHKKSSSQPRANTPTQFTFDDSIIKCFSTLSPKCRDEELEDIVYFVLDLYQFHGVPVAIAELDIDQVVIDLRMVLEDHLSKTSKASKTPPTPIDEHMFLILDKNVQGLPWESMPVLRGRSVSRIPGIQFLQDRLSFARMKREAAGLTYDPKDGAIVDPSKGYYILNPSGDLGRTEERFRDWASDMKKSGWGGTIGKQVSEQQFVDALKTQDLVVYFGHGGGEQYVRSHKIRSLPTCAATMLWGCSSGALRDMGDFDRTGTPYNYMLGGCPTLVANLWDVTDKDIDKFSQAVFDKLGLVGKPPNDKRPRSSTSLIAAVAQSRDSCKLKYLTGAAPVVYGIPFYL
ncbi:cysteine peptidase C50 [Pholiota conissans]|uniref:separase n=1 Tax=Pholiota conissans TaxID=109636 RepID=A0A9P5Z233_9AGAR|nr:cysteine peptidase C50 [Pholiota conissans]